MSSASRLKNLRILMRLALFAVFLVICYYWIYPFIWLLSASLKTKMEVFREGLKLIPDKFMWSNYRNAWVEAKFGRYMFNTVLITIATVLLAVIRSGMAGYVFGRFDFVGKKLLMGLIIATFVVPRGYTIIPIVEVSRRLGTLNSLAGTCHLLIGRTDRTFKRATYCLAYIHTTIVLCILALHFCLGHFRICLGNCRDNSNVCQ